MGEKNLGRRERRGERGEGRDQKQSNARAVKITPKDMENEHRMKIKDKQHLCMYNRRLKKGRKVHWNE